MALARCARSLPETTTSTPLAPDLHHEPHDAVARPPYGQTAQQFVLERLGLGLRAQPSVRHALGVQFDGAVLEVEPLLDHRREFPDALALLAEHVLRPGGADDDLRAQRRHSHFHARVAVLRELAREELVELGVEEAVGHELALLRDLRHFACDAFGERRSFAAGRSLCWWRFLFAAASDGVRLRSWVSAPAAAVPHRRHKAGERCCLAASCVLARSASCGDSTLRESLSEGARGSCDETRARTGCQLSRETAIKSKLRFVASDRPRVLESLFCAGARQAPARNTPRTDGPA